MKVSGVQDVNGLGLPRLKAWLRLKMQPPACRSLGLDRVSKYRHKYMAVRLPVYLTAVSINAWLSCLSSFLCLTSTINYLTIGNNCDESSLFSLPIKSNLSAKKQSFLCSSSCILDF